MSRLPQQFRELEPFCDRWLKDTENARNRVRINASLDENRAFYDAVMARFPEILTYLDGFTVTDLPEPERNLLELVCAFVEASCAVERFDSPIVTDTFPSERFVIHEDSPATGW